MSVFTGPVHTIWRVLFYVNEGGDNHSEETKSSLWTSRMSSACGTGNKVLRETQAAPPGGNTAGRKARLWQPLAEGK